MIDRILELAFLFSQVHIGDNDCLGKAANELMELIKGVKPDIGRPKDIDC